jgi:glycosyltransferase involved in cell wall biosynthesis
MGCGYTKRRCAELASGDYCGFLDPDDELLPNALELMVNTHQNNPNVSIIFSRNYICDLNMNILYTSRHLSLPQGVSYLENNDFESEAFVSYTKKAYLSTNGISANYYAGVDAELNFLLEEVGDLYILNEVTYKYRRYKIDSITANKMTASYYNFMIRLDAYNRRKIKNVQNIFYAYEQCVNMVVDNRLDIQQRKIRSSKAYRLGRLLLTPFKFFNFL